MISRAFTKAAIAVAALAVAGSAYSHAIWVEHNFGKDVVGFGHQGTDTDSYPAERITKVIGYNTKGESVDVAKKDEGDFVSLELGKAALVGLEMDNGYWAQGGDGEWYNKKGDQVEGAKTSRHVYKFNTHYANSRVEPKKIGHILEIVPDVNPASLSKGDKLTVTVLYEGKPLEGAVLDSNYFDQDKQSYTTDAQGKATFPVEVSGFNLVEVGKNIVNDSDPFEGKGLSASLSFESKNDHHH